MIKQSLKYIICVILTLGGLIVVAQDKTTIEAVSFNSLESEYAPVYFNKGLVFCSNNIKNEALTYVDSETGKQLTDLFYVEKDSAGFGIPKVFSKTIKTPFHDGPITFSADEKIAYFTRTQLVNKKLKNSIKTENKAGIFRALFNGQEWSEIQSLPFNSENHNVYQPSLSKDGKTIYVVSDKEGGFGGKDIYFSKLENGIWSDLINLGDQVNSSANEIFPFINAKGKLFYSSDKDGGNGGLDIYTASKNNGEWRENLLEDSPLNSQFDDFSIVWNKENTEGYFTSNRTGNDDLFKINIIYPEFKDCEELKEEQLCFEFFEEATLNADSVEMLYEWNFGDGTKEQKLEVYHCYTDPGLYIVELNVMDTMIDKTFINEATYELEILSIPQPLVICPDSVFINEPFTVEVKQGKWVNYIIGNVYLDFGDEKVIKSRNEKHSYGSIGVRNFQVLITGKNLESGEIETTCFYKTIKVLKKEGVEEKGKMTLLEQQGFMIKEKIEEDDEDMFFALELMSSPTSILKDSSILKEYNDNITEHFDSEKKLYSYTVGQSNSPFDLIDEFREAHKNGFDNAEVKQYNIPKNESLFNMGYINIDKKGNSSFILEGVLFDYESYELTRAAKRELKNLVSYLQNNKEINIEVGAHTDSKGNDDYNQKLSQNRANSVVDYLILKGINIKRLKANGYGESQPIATNETPEGRAKNRRVSFKILTE